MKTDDPKLTAYALDELAPAERAEIEALLNDEPALAAEIEATRGLAAQLRSELHAEEGAPLSVAQRREVLAAADAGQSAALVKVITFPRRAAVLSAIAACLIVGLSLALLYPAMQAEKAAVQRSMARGTAEVGASSVVGLEVDPAQMTPVVPSTSAFTPSLTNHALNEVGVITANPEVRLAASGAQAALPLQAPTSFVQNRAELSAAVEEVSRLAEAQKKYVGGHFGVAGSGVTPTPEIQTKALTELRIAAKGSAAGMSGRMGGSARSAAAVPPGRTSASVRPREPGLLPESDGYGLPPAKAVEAGGNTEAYDAITDNAFLAVKDNPLSTFSIDVDTASYANVRRFLTSGALPPKGAVRIEEMVNYFTYDYPQPAGDAPFSATMEVAACPWTPEHRLVRVGLKGRDLARSERPAANLVFLIDVSGSMRPENKLPLVKESLRLLVDQIDDRDQVAIAVYAGASGTVLEPTRDKAAMRRALDRLEAGGSTNGAGGIQLAYQLARKSFLKGGTNRVILATDGDFNVGITNQSDLVDLIEREAKSGVFLTVLGYGMGNLKDSTLEKLADKGNGNYGYIDTLLEAKKTLVEQMNGTLYTIAKDVKIQVEFNPAQARAYRLIGYENRMLAKEDFNNDKKDAGEIGAGHSVTALYEIVPAGREVPVTAPAVDELKYLPVPTAETASRKPVGPAELATRSGELLTLKLRHKAPDGDVSTKLEFPLTDRGETWEKSSKDFRWAAAVASFGMLLRDSPHKGRATWDSTLELAHEGKGDDATGYRAECVTLIEKARSMGR